MDNPLVLPQIGLIFWTCLVFCILLFLLKKFAWKPILSAVKERESKIEEALESAENAKLEMAKLKSQNEDMKKEALAEREAMMKEAKEIKANSEAIIKSKERFK